MGQDTKGKLLYSVDDGRRPYAYGYPRSDADKAAAPHHVEDVYTIREAVEVDVRDARDQDMSLAANGFQLVEHPTALEFDDFYGEPEALQAKYFPEMEEMVKKTTGAAHVHMFHHELRNGARADVDATFSHKLKCIKNYLPFVHSDSHARHATQQFQEFAKHNMTTREFSKGRFVFFTAWRSIDPDSPVQDNPLAVCDERSLVNPDDYIPSDLFLDKFNTKQLYHLDKTNHKRHKWYYYPAMQKHEVLIFKNWDSDRDAPARIVFHTAFSDPNAPADAKPRQSIEARGFAYFPDHVPDTCGHLIAPFEDRDVGEAVGVLVGAVAALPYWPEAGQQWARGLVMSGEFGDMLTGMINNAQNGLGLHAASPDNKEAIKQAALASTFPTVATEALAKCTEAPTEPTANGH